MVTWQEILSGSPSASMRFGGEPVPLKDVTRIFKAGKWDTFLKEILWSGFGAEADRPLRGHFFTIYQPEGYNYPFAIYCMATADNAKNRHSLGILRGQNPAMVVTLFDDKDKNKPERALLVNDFAVPVVNLGLYLDARKLSDHLGQAVSRDIHGLKYEDVLRSKGIAFNGVYPPAQGLAPLPAAGGAAPKRLGVYDVGTIMVEIRMPDNKTKKVPVEAFIYKGYAVHKPYKADPTEKRTPGIWTVTHTGSGLAFGSLPRSRKSALDAIKILADKWGDVSNLTDKQVLALGRDFAEDFRHLVYYNDSEIKP
ncbi:MAG: hypothetical protein ABIJ57_01670 [Pseudomonadota bacterium]